MSDSFEKQLKKAVKNVVDAADQVCERDRELILALTALLGLIRSAPGPLPAAVVEGVGRSTISGVQAHVNAQIVKRGMERALSKVQIRALFDRLNWWLRRDELLYHCQVDLQLMAGSPFVGLHKGQPALCMQTYATMLRSDVVHLRVARWLNAWPAPTVPSLLGVVTPPAARAAVPSGPRTYANLEMALTWDKQAKVLVTSKALPTANAGAHMYFVNFSKGRDARGLLWRGTWYPVSWTVPIP